MKEIQRILTIIAALLIFSPRAAAQEARPELPPDAVVLLDSAVRLVDSDEVPSALKIFDKLHKQYKDNYQIGYERLYAYYVHGDYKRVVKEGRKLYDLPGADFMCYQMVGNAQDNLGDAEAAIKTYDEGLVKFPSSGALYLEKGNIYMMHERYDLALANYSDGVEAEPTFASNYYRLARLYAMSTEPVWAIMYAETFRRISSDKARREEMRALIRNLYDNNVKFDADSVTVTLQEEKTIFLNADSSLVVPFGVAYDAGVRSAAEALPAERRVSPLSLQTLFDLRQSAVEYICDLLPDQYNVSLMDYHRRLIQSGNWYAYNMAMLANDEEIKMWFETDSAETQLQKLAQWQRDNPFVASKDCLTLKARQYKREYLDIPSPAAITTAEGCREHEADVLRLAKWFLAEPLNRNSATPLKAIQFIMMWMTNTEDYTFSITQSPVSGNTELLSAFLAAMCEHAIEFGVKQTDEAMFCEVMTQVFDYYKRNRDVIGELPSVARYLEMDGATLRDTLAEEYRRNSK